MLIRTYRSDDLPQMISIWNEVVEDGIAFPQEEFLDEASGAEFFASQTYTAAAEEDGEIVGLYILHPNNIGRCGHIANASFAVKKTCRGKHIGDQLVRDCIEQSGKHGFRMKDGSYEDICPCCIETE